MVDRAYLEGPCNVIASEEHPTLLWKAGFGSRLCLGAMSFGRGWSLRYLIVQSKIAFIAKMHPSIYYHVGLQLFVGCIVQRYLNVQIVQQGCRSCNHINTQYTCSCACSTADRNGAAQAQPRLQVALHQWPLCTTVLFEICSISMLLQGEWKGLLSWTAFSILRAPRVFKRCYMGVSLRTLNTV